MTLNRIESPVDADERTPLASDRKRSHQFPKSMALSRNRWGCWACFKMRKGARGSHPGIFFSNHDAPLPSAYKRPGEPSKAGGNLSVSSSSSAPLVFFACEKRDRIHGQATRSVPSSSSSVSSCSSPIPSPVRHLFVFVLDRSTLLVTLDFGSWQILRHI
jgi:hypothetical protein